MDLHFQQVLPEPIQLNKPSEVWNCDFKFSAEEKVFVRAASGKGKSTFLHILYGLRKDYSGNAFWQQQEIKSISDTEWANLRQKELSIVFQDLRLFDELTVLENIQVKQHLQPKLSLEKIKEYLNELGLGNQFNQLAQTLSYGEKQRVAIIRALVQPFSWILLDEPFSHLDDKNIEKVAHLIDLEVKENKAGLVLVDLESSPWFEFTRTLML